MSDPVASVICPNGHLSGDRSYCSVCGVQIADPGPPPYTAADSTPTGSFAGRSALPVPEAPEPLRPLSVPPLDAGGPDAPPEAGWVCSHCSAELDASARFCEVCGYDPTTGSLPAAQAPVVRPATSVGPGVAPAPPAAPLSPLSPLAPSSASVPSSRSSASMPSASMPSAAVPPAVPGATRLVAVITADRDYYGSQDINEVQFPLGVPPRAIELPAGPVSIGRRSRSRGTNPAIDLAGPPEDPAVSHSHASLLPGEDGTWVLVDHGSTNGTFLNESPDPVPANQPLPVGPGDRVYVGAWTRITLERHPLS